MRLLFIFDIRLTGGLKSPLDSVQNSIGFILLGALNWYLPRQRQQATLFEGEILSNTFFFFLHSLSWWCRRFRSNWAMLTKHCLNAEICRRKKLCLLLFLFNGESLLWVEKKKVVSLKAPPPSPSKHNLMEYNFFSLVLSKP